MDTGRIPGSTRLYDSACIVDASDEVLKRDIAGAVFREEFVESLRDDLHEHPRMFEILRPILVNERNEIIKLCFQQNERGRNAIPLTRCEFDDGAEG